MRPAQTGDATNGRCEVQRAFAEDRVAIVAGAVIGDTTVDACGSGQCALIGFIVLAVHVEQATNVLQELALR
ncbi:hypothetical protein D3C72_1353540 [compost metagenome]